MRKTFAAIATLALVLGTAGAALATFHQHATVLFSAHKAHQSTGLKSDLHAGWASGDTLKSPKTVMLTFPVKTRFNLKVVKRCSYTDAQLSSPTAPKTCPKHSQIGTGSGAANLGPTPSSLATVPLTVKAFVRNASTIVIVANAMGSNVVLSAVARGNKLTIKVPAVKVSGIPVIVTSLKLKVPRKGTGKKALITTGRCIKGKFTTNVRWTYYSGTADKATATSKCS